MGGQSRPARRSASPAAAAPTRRSPALLRQSVPARASSAPPPRTRLLSNAPVSWVFSFADLEAPRQTPAQAPKVVPAPREPAKKKQRLQNSSDDVRQELASAVSQLEQARQQKQQGEASLKAISDTFLSAKLEEERAQAAVRDLEKRLEEARAAHQSRVQASSEIARARDQQAELSRAIAQRCDELGKRVTELNARFDSAMAAAKARAQAAQSAAAPAASEIVSPIPHREAAPPTSPAPLDEEVLLGADAMHVHSESRVLDAVIPAIAPSCVVSLHVPPESHHLAALDDSGGSGDDVLTGLQLPRLGEPDAVPYTARIRAERTTGRLPARVLASQTYSNRVDPVATLCRFDLHGKCNDDECPWLHVSDVRMAPADVLRDIASRAPGVLSRAEVERYVGALRTMRLEDVVGSMTAAMRDRGVPPYASLVPRSVARNRRPLPPRPLRARARRAASDAPAAGEEVEEDVVEDTEEQRYCKGDDEEPTSLDTDTSGTGVERALKMLERGTDASSADKRDAALNALARALEEAPTDPDLWRLHLRLYSQRFGNTSPDDVKQAFEEAVSRYAEWCKGDTSAKVAVCNRAVGSLLEQHMAESDGDSFSPASRERAYALVEIILEHARMLASMGLANESMAVLLAYTEDWADSLPPLAYCALTLAYVYALRHRRLPTTPAMCAMFGPKGSRFWQMAIDWRSYSVSDGVSLHYEMPKTGTDELLAKSREHLLAAAEMLASTGASCESLMLIINCALLYTHVGLDDEAAALCHKHLASHPESWQMRVLHAALCVAGPCPCPVPPLNAGDSGYFALRVFEAHEHVRHERWDAAADVLSAAVAPLVAPETAAAPLVVYQVLLGCASPKTASTVHLAPEVSAGAFSGDVHCWMAYALCASLRKEPAAVVEDVRAVHQQASCALSDVQDKEAVWLQCALLVLHRWPASTGALFDAALLCVPAAVPVPIQCYHERVHPPYLKDYQFSNVLAMAHLTVLPVWKHSAFLFHCVTERQPSNTDLATLGAKWEAKCHRSPMRALVLCRAPLEAPFAPPDAWAGAAAAAVEAGDLMLARNFFERAVLV
eukprot:m51a1_g6758 hypothetical protein (1068) ;mRNA; f:87123-90745